MNLNKGSFRDPAGQVFSRDGKIYRSIFTPGVSAYERARDAGIYTELIATGLLLPHEEISPGNDIPEETVYCLQHPTLPFVSYPWEWTFSMLKDAALLHLDIMERLLPKGFWLRDASAFNVQYDKQRLRLIDTLSIGQRVPDSPWVAYRQFCSHFLAPLAMAAYGDIRMLGLWRNSIDGYPLDLAVNSLPAWRRYIPRLFMHLTMHARLQQSADRKEDIGKHATTGNARVSDLGLLGIVRSLRRTIEKIHWKRSSKIWEAYSDIRTYQMEDVSAKTEFIHKIMQRLKPQMVWDLGANIGEFSLIAASNGAFVVSIEGDPACSEHLYQKLSQEHIKDSVLPITMDIANPSPSLGWDSCERLSLKERGPTDILLALALIHHLVFSSSIPLSRIAGWFASLARYVIVEFVPPTDPMVRKILQNRGTEHLPYNKDVFLSSFGALFNFEDQKVLKNARTLYFCKRRK